VTKLSGGSTVSFEYGIWKLVFKKNPSASTHRQFVNDFFQFMETAMSQYSNLFVTGDFNLHLNENSLIIDDFNSSLNAMGLEQHVDFSTHVSGHCLDLVITESLNVHVMSCKPGPFISDHCVIKTVLDIKKDNAISKSVASRNYKRIDNIEFFTALYSIEVEDQSIDTFVEQFESKLFDVLEQHAPLKEKTCVCRSSKPWFNEDIVQLKRQSRKLELFLRKYPEQSNFEAFKTASLRTKYFDTIVEEQKHVVSEKMVSAKGNSKKLYSLVCELTGTKVENPLPDNVADT